MQKTKEPPRSAYTGGNWFKQIISEMFEFIQHCFGVNDVAKRYERDVKEVKRQADNEPDKCGGHDQMTKFTR